MSFLCYSTPFQCGLKSKLFENERIEDVCRRRMLTSATVFTGRYCLDYKKCDVDIVVN